MPLRVMPHVGSLVRVNFLGATVRGAVHRVADDGRELEVATDDGEIMIFALNGATGTFTAEGHQTGARLSFEVG
jgi:hypothetical protein